MSAAHKKACLSQYWSTFKLMTSSRMRFLHLLYVKELKWNVYENSNYHSEKLLKCLQNDPIKDHINFTEVDHDKANAISFWLMYSSNITVSNSRA